MAEDGAEGSPLPIGFSSGLSRDDPHSKSATNSDKSREPPPVAAESREIFRALEVVERDSIAIAESFASLFSSLRLALSEVTSISVENMQCFRDVVGQLQESALDAATKGNRYINSCLRRRRSFNMPKDSDIGWKRAQEISSYFSSLKC